MKKVIILLLSIINCQLSICQIGTWHNYLSYYNVQQIQAVGNDIFVMASNGLYQYNKQDKSIYTYDKTKGLSDVTITNIKWCSQAKRLVVIYDTSNIDLVEPDGSVTNISSIYSKSITGGKNIYGITIYNQYAYLSTDFGVVKLNVKDAEISESYMLGFAVKAVAFEGNQIYAQSSENGVWKADLSKNLIDPNNWTQTDTYPSFEEDKTDYNNYIEEVSTLKPEGPIYNLFYESKFYNGKLYTTGGYFLSGIKQMRNPGIVQVFDGSNWTLYPTNLNEITGFSYTDNNCIDVDPTDSSHVVVGGKSGLYEFQNGQLKKYHYQGNSPIRPVLSNGTYLPNHYTLIHGIKFDNNGNLWVLNSQTDVNLFLLTKSGEWKNLTKSELYYIDNISYPGMRSVILDSRNYLWFVNTNWSKPSVFCYKIDTEEIITYNNFENQDGVSYNENILVYDVKEDKSGNIWIATRKGPFYIKSEEAGLNNATIYQEKVPRNDGTNYADYLLTDIDTRCICIDGGGRKWIGTTGNGVFLISQDNMEQIHHFLTDNSKLISNNILSISINDQTGEVFFLTDKGLCSYVSDASEPNSEMSKDNVWAYPNPVTPDYTGSITITGLTINADVKILSTNGALIAEGRSNGGTFVWDGCNKNGERVASGIYMVATATSDGQKGTVCKIAIVR